MIVRESIYESIKHLTPRSEEEILKNTDKQGFYETISVACQNNLLSVVKKLFDSEEMIKEKGGYAIGLASIYDRYDIIKYLIEIGVDPASATEENDNKTLKFTIDNSAFYANPSNCKKIIELLIQDKRVINALTPEQRTFLEEHDFI